MAAQDAGTSPIEDSATTAETHELPASEEERRQEASVTFANVGRLHAFLKARGRAGGWRANAPLAAMKYIHELEHIRRAVERFLANTAERP